MSKLHVFSALLGMTLSVVALADKKPESPAAVKPQPGMVATVYTQAEILNPTLGCLNFTRMAFKADIKNAGTATASYTPALVLTQRGECTKWDWKKNSDGSPCKPNPLCAGYCVTRAPDKVVTYTPTPTAMSIAAGATMHLYIDFADMVDMKKAEIKVLEQGRGSLVTKPVAVISSCSNVPPR